MAVPEKTLESGVVPSSHKRTATESSGFTFISQATKEQKENDQALKNLRKFQVALGIKTPSRIKVPSDPEEASSNSNSCLTTGKRPGRNHGIYTRLVVLEKRRKFWYQFFTYVTNICLLAQLAFAAVLTALGASEAPHTVVTVFGAVNTALAGILALLKGHGLPERERQDLIGLMKVRDYIDERERLLEEGVYMDNEVMQEDENGVVIKQVDIKAEIKKVLDMYSNQIATMEANRPDTYVFARAGAAAGTGPEHSKTGAAFQV